MTTFSAATQVGGKDLRPARHGFLAALTALSILLPAGIACAQDDIPEILGQEMGLGTDTEKVEPVGGQAPLSQQPQMNAAQAPVLNDDVFALDNQGRRIVRSFGSQLFSKPSIMARFQTTNPNYIIDVGDRIAINLWGGATYQGVQTVDGDGNIFIPEIGPVRVAGRSANDLNGTVQGAVGKVYTENVGSYVNLMSRQPIGVFVTGAVRNPGRYAGERSGSLISFLIQSGGIVDGSGSYRDIRVIRSGKVLGVVDLYDFLLDGSLPDIKLRDNDAILVGPQSTTVVATGDVRNAYRFEIDTTSTHGADLLSLARPLTTVSNVAVRGIRDGKPYSAYLTLEEFKQMAMRNGDEYTFTSDAIAGSIFVSVSGQSSGPSQFAVPKTAKLRDVLRLIEVDPEQVDLSAVYLRRKSVAESEGRALQLALSELQQAVLTTPAESDSDAKIRASEANLVERFVKQARSVRPEGRVVLAGIPAGLDTTLEPDDEIIIPSRSNLVMISGEVRLPQTVIFEPDHKIKDYAQRAGGFTNRADEDEFVVIRRSGAVVVGPKIEIMPGDHLMIMPEADTRTLVIVKDIIDVVYRAAIAAAVVLRPF